MSVKVPPKGTKGVPFPRFLVRLGSRFAPGMFRRRPNKTGGGIATLLLETKGAKSGKTRNAILGYLEEGPDAWLVIASLGGASRQPGWMYNLAKEPHATIEFYGGQRVDVEARTLVGMTTTPHGSASRKRRPSTPSTSRRPTARSPSSA